MIVRKPYPKVYPLGHQSTRKLIQLSLAFLPNPVTEQYRLAGDFKEKSLDFNNYSYLCYLLLKQKITNQTIK